MDLIYLIIILPFLFLRAYKKVIENLTSEGKMKALLVVVLMVVSFGAAANYDCYKAALNDFASDSMAYQIYDEEISMAFEDNGVNASVKAVRSLESKLGCVEKSFEISKASCKEVVPGNSISKVCYLESQLGYFFISMDMMEKVNIVFNRWD